MRLTAVDLVWQVRASAHHLDLDLAMGPGLLVCHHCFLHHGIKLFS